MENPAAEVGKLSQTAITEVAFAHRLSRGLRITLVYNDH